jgi:hypothetical protein
VAKAEGESGDERLQTFVGGSASCFFKGNLGELRVWQKTWGLNEMLEEWFLISEDFMG